MTKNFENATITAKIHMHRTNGFVKMHSHPPYFDFSIFQELPFSVEFVTSIKTIKMVFAVDYI